MNLDAEFHAGELEQPVVVLVHGLGMDRRFWHDPSRCGALGAMMPLSIFFSGPPGPDDRGRLSLGRREPGHRGLADVLATAGFSVAAWSQQEPLGPIMAAVAELAWVMEEARRRWPGRPLFLVGHSRGGLVAWKYLLDSGVKDVRGLITIATPHQGTEMARLAGYLRPGARLVDRILPEQDRGAIFPVLKRLAAFLSSPATLELRPASPLLRSLGTSRAPALPTLSFGGIDPVLFRLYLRTRSDRPWRGISFPQLLARAIPERRLPPELKAGEGDGLVAARSADPATGRHVILPANHVALAFERRAQELIVEFLTGREGPEKP